MRRQKKLTPSTCKEDSKTFPKLYVAETGYYVDNDPTILGLNTAQFISDTFHFVWASSFFFSKLVPVFGAG